MVKYYPSLNETHLEFITSQPLFFVASAPWSGTHINLSPKGHPSRSFSVLNATTVAYLDATGSGCETISHIYENGRVTIMFCSFGTSPQIMRLFCTGRVVEKWDRHYQELRARMATENGDEVDLTGARAIIVLKIQKVQTSCGFGVPLLDKKNSSSTAQTNEDGSTISTDAVTMVEHDNNSPENDGWVPRDTMDNWARKQVEKKELTDYQRRMNVRSLDGLPGLMSARRANDENLAVEDTKAWFRKISKQQDAIALGFGLGFLFVVFLGLIGVLDIKPTFVEHILNFQRRQMGEAEVWSKSEL